MTRTMCRVAAFITVVAAALGVARLTGWVPVILMAAVEPTTPTTERVSVANDGSQANDVSEYVALSADGRYVAFASDATELVTGDSNGNRDVFVRDRRTGRTERVSLASDASQGNDYSAEPAISADGRYVAFRSGATNLAAGDTNGYFDIFVRDREARTTELVSIASDGSQANTSSFRAVISSDGRYVAFMAHDTSLVAGDTNGFDDVFVRDRVAGTTERVNVASDSRQGNGVSLSYAMSGDGRYVAFESDATNLVAGDTNGISDIFVRDRVAGTTRRVSVALDGSQSNGYSRDVAISADGRYVAFYSGATNLVAGTVNAIAVFVRDRAAGTTERVSVRSDGSQPPLTINYHPSISADGRYVAFVSTPDSTLVDHDTNGAHDVFVHDRVTRTTERVSVNSDGDQGNDESFAQTLNAYGGSPFSADGRYVAFTSNASNLVKGDTNGVSDVFVRDRATGVAAPTVSVGDAQVIEGNDGLTSLTFRVLLSAATDKDVTFQFSTENVTARNGADYEGRVGTRRILAGATTTAISVQVFGDSQREHDETLHLNIDTPFNATIADGQGLGTIVNDDVCCFAAIGTFELEPGQATVAVREHLTYLLTWTVPSGSWRALESVELRIGDGGSVLWVRFDEASGTLRLVDPASGALGPAFVPGRPNRLQTNQATVYLAASSVTGSGPTGPSVTLALDLSFKPQAAGQSHVVDVRATNDAGETEVFHRGATVTVVPR